MNAGKRDKVGDRQRALAQRLYEPGLLSKRGLKAVARTANEPQPLWAVSTGARI